MNNKEWRRRELFHLLMDKFGLRTLNEFKITGTSTAGLPAGSGDEFDFAGSDSKLTKALDSSDFTNKLKTPEVGASSQSKRVDSLSWDSNLGQQKSFKTDDSNFDKQIEAFKSAIASKESGNLGYEALGIPVQEYGYNGDRARGKYQIMGKNWPKWAKEAGLPESTWDPNTGMTPKNQEYVASYKFKQYYDQFGGDWRKVAIAWYSGPKGMDKKANNYKKVYHKGHDKPFPSIAEYGDDIISRMKNRSG